MKLKEIREEKNLKQAEVAKILGVSRSVYGMWEQGHDFIPLKRLNNFCNIFAVSLDYVLELSDKRTYNNKQAQINLEQLTLRIKDLRKKNNLTQEKLAKELNITRSLISKYENGTNLILTSFLIEYCKYFKVSADYLTGRVDEEIVFPDFIKLG